MENIHGYIIFAISYVLSETIWVCIDVLFQVIQVGKRVDII